MLQTVFSLPRPHTACLSALLPHRQPHVGEHAWLLAGRGLKPAAGGSVAFTACLAAGRRRQKANEGGGTESVQSSSSKGKQARAPKQKKSGERVIELGSDGRVRRREEVSELDEMLSVGLDKQAGVLPPLMCFDPLGFVGRNGNPKDNFVGLRGKELKHGRLAMMAVAGAIGQHWLRFPMFDGTPRGFRAFTTSEGRAGFVLLLLFAAFIEVSVGVQKPDKRPGDFGDPWGFAEKLKGFGTYDEREWMNKELSNGRLAMIVIAIAFVREQQTDLDAIDQVFYTLGLLPGVITK